MSLRSTTGGGPMLLFVVVFLVAVYVVVAGGLGALINPYTINTWLVYLDKPPNVEWWHGALLGIAPLSNTVTIPAGIITWICMLFLA